MRVRGIGLLVVVLTACVIVTSCDGDADEATSTTTAAATHAGGAAAPSTTAPITTIPAKASRRAPLAEREFRINPKPTTPAEQAALRALQGYLDGLIKAFATNDLARSGVRGFTSPAMYADAQRLVDEQVNAPKGGYVLYGAYTITIQLRGASTRAAVGDVCVDQSQTRRHNPKTDAAGRRNNSPYVRITYTLNRLEAGWVVVDYSGRDVASCPD